jgi:hypothetical protein
MPLSLKAPPCEAGDAAADKAGFNRPVALHRSAPSLDGYRSPLVDALRAQLRQVRAQRQLPH